MGWERLAKDPDKALEIAEALLVRARTVVGPLTADEARACLDWAVHFIDRGYSLDFVWQALQRPADVARIIGRQIEAAQPVGAVA